METGLLMAMTEFDDVYAAMEEAQFCAEHDKEDQALWHDPTTGRYVIEPLREAATKHILEIFRHESD